MKLGNERTLFCMTDVAEVWILRDLSFGEVRSILASRRRDQDQNIYIWTEAWPDWKNLEDPETLSFLSQRRETQKPPGLPLVPFMMTEDTRKTKAPGSIPQPRLASKTQPSTPAQGPVKNGAETKPKPAKVQAPNLQSLKGQTSSRFRSRESNQPTFSIEDVVGQLGDHEPQTLEPFPKQPVQKSPKAKTPGDGKDAGNRRYDRYPVNISVKIVNNTQRYLTVTRDISEGGLRLADSLPETFAGYCQVVLSPANHKPFELLCSLVEDQEDGKYHLEFVDNDARAVFIAWLRRQKWAAA